MTLFFKKNCISPGLYRAVAARTAPRRRRGRLCAHTQSQHPAGMLPDDTRGKEQHRSCRAQGLSPWEPLTCWRHVEGGEEHSLASQLHAKRCQQLLFRPGLQQIPHTRAETDGGMPRAQARGRRSAAVLRESSRRAGEQTW